MSKTRTKPKSTGDAPPTKRILLVGDWVIDDNWVVGSHKSDLSTGVGEQYYRSLHQPGNVVRKFCGAGRVGSLIRHGAISDTFVDVTGLGLWHPDDQNLLKAMFVPSNMYGNSPYSLSSGNNDKQLADSVDRVTLVNLDPLLKAAGVSRAVTNPLSDEEIARHIAVAPQQYIAAHGTTRVFRVCQQSGSRLEQLNRIDWECSAPKQPNRPPEWISDAVASDVKLTHEWFKLLPGDVGDTPFDAVVLKDLGKGVISSGLLTALLARYPDLHKRPWFVSTKYWSPPWLDVLVQNKIPVKLVVYPEVAIRQNREVFA